MAGDSSLAELLNSKIGLEGMSGEYVIEPGMVRRFIRAVGEASPRWGEVAPPTLLPVIGFEQMLDVLTSIPSQTLLHGGTEMESFRQVRVGDTIKAVTKVARLRERQGGRLGKMIFLTLETTYENQRGETAGLCRQTLVSYQQTGEEGS